MISISSRLALSATLGVATAAIGKLLFSNISSEKKSLLITCLGLSATLMPQIAKSLKGRVTLDLRVLGLFTLISTIIAIATSRRTKAVAPTPLPIADGRMVPATPILQQIEQQANEEGRRFLERFAGMSASEQLLAAQGLSQGRQLQLTVSGQVFLLDNPLYRQPAPAIQSRLNQLVEQWRPTPLLASQLPDEAPSFLERAGPYLAAVNNVDEERSNDFVVTQLAPALKRLGVLPIFLSTYDACVHPVGRGVAATVNRLAPESVLGGIVAMVADQPADQRIYALRERCNQRWKWSDDPVAIKQPTPSGAQRALVVIGGFKGRLASGIAWAVASRGLSDKRAEAEVDRFTGALKANVAQAVNRASGNPALASALPAIVHVLLVRFRPRMIQMLQEANLNLNQMYVKQLFANHLLNGVAEALCPGYADSSAFGLYQDCLRLNFLQYIHENVSAVLTLKNAAQTRKHSLTFNKILASSDGSDIDKALNTLFNPEAKQAVLAGISVLQIALSVKNADENSPALIQTCKAAAEDFWAQPSSARMMELQRVLMQGALAGQAAFSAARAGAHPLRDALADTQMTRISRFNTYLVAAPNILNLVAQLGHAYSGNAVSASAMAMDGAAAAAKIAAGEMSAAMGARALAAGADAAGLDDLSTKFIVALLEGASKVHEGLNGQRQLQS